jgi:hypothetical protein
MSANELRRGVGLPAGEHLPGHDDRKEYLAGIDLILGGFMK